MKHVKTVDQTLTLEIGYASDIGPSALTDAIIEALEDVLNEANIVYIKATCPTSSLVAVDLWAPEAVEEVEPPEIPEAEGPEPNV